MTTVSLDVRNPQCPVLPGWTTVQASNGQQYSYLYSGGTDGRGDAEFQVGTGQQQVQINLVCDIRYQIQSVSVSGDARGDFSISGSDPRSRTITDTDNDEETVEYSVTVLDTTANCTISCDPQIRNQP